MNKERSCAVAVIVGGKWLYALGGNGDGNSERIELSKCGEWELIDLPNVCQAYSYS